MKQYKILFGIVMVMMMVGIVNAEELYHAYNESQWGNLHIQAGSSGGETIGGANNVSVCVPTTAPKDGFVSSFITSGTFGFAMEYCINNERRLPASAIGCNTTVSGIMSFSYENVTNYLNYEFYEGEDMYFCIQEPTDNGVNVLDIHATNSYVYEDKNNTWHSFSSSDPTDLRQYKFSDSESFGARYWRWTDSGGVWAEQTKYPEEFQFCMKESAGDTEECYALGSKAQNQYQSCGDDDVKIGEEFRWYGDDNTEFNQIDLWLYEGTGMWTGSKIKIGVDEINKTTNITTPLWLGNEHNYSEFNITTPIIGMRKVTELIPFTNVTFMEDHYYRVFVLCDQCGSGIDGVNGICTASTREEVADGYSFIGFQDTTGVYFREESGSTVYTTNRDMPFLMTTGSGTVWQTTPECNDTIDNDGDGYIDYPDDPSCSSEADTTEDPFDYPACNDTLDNDGDSFIDYPNDPSCDNATDETELPFDNPQCNDGIDNDLDGFTDFPDDPSCSGVTDNDESPADNSSQEEDDCLQSLDCLIYDSIPYSDDPFLHGWYGGQVSDAQIVGFLGGYSIDLDTNDGIFKENVIIFKNISHTNNYNSLYGQFVLALLEDDTGDPIVSEPVYVGFYDNTDNNLITAVLNVSSSATAYDIEADLYVYDEDHWEFVSTLYTDDSDNGFIRLEFDIDEVTNEFEISWTDMIGSFEDTTTYEFDNFGFIYKAMVTNTIDRDDGEILLNLVELKGTDTLDLETTCDTWVSPFHLKENFNGYMSECDWNVDPDQFMWAKLSMQNEIEDFYLFKIFDDDSDNAIYYDKSRYSTVKFDYKPYDDSTSVNNMNLYLYDLAFQTTYVRLFFKTNGNVDATVSGDNYNVFSGLVMNTSKEVMIVLDLLEDTFNFYYDGALENSNIGFHNEFYNAEYFNGIYFQSGSSHYEIDNLEVYESSSDGEPSSNVKNPVIIPDADLSWCELFTKVDQSCSVDSDCETGECLPNGKCSHFNFNYCDENGHTRGNKCVVAGMSSCVLTSTGDLILDNFFLFLVFLVIIMGLVYMSIMLRN